MTQNQNRIMCRGGESHAALKRLRPVSQASRAPGGPYPLSSTLGVLEFWWLAVSKTANTLGYFPVGQSHDGFQLKVFLYFACWHFQKVPTR